MSSRLADFHAFTTVLIYIVLRFVHQDHRPTFDRLMKLVQMDAGETVLEVGCGTGMLSRRFVSQGYHYWGIDVDPERIAIAAQQAPGARFLVCDALSPKLADLPEFRRVFIHGVLHHLDDSQCRCLLDRILSVGSDVVLAVIEPFRPAKWWTSPRAALCSRRDEGRFFRTLPEWLDLFRPNVEVFETRSLWPRWPVHFIDARLRPGTPKPDELAARSQALHFLTCRPFGERVWQGDSIPADHYPFRSFTW